MRFIIPILFYLVALSTTSYGQQNHVVNGNFENYIQCPNGGSQIYNCVGWSRWNGGSPDYFNTCGSLGGGAPSNWPGYQQPASGNGYVGMVDLWSYGGHTEFIHSTMTPLQVGSFYEVSISISCANLTKYATNGMAMYFFDNGPAFYASHQIIPAVTPQIHLAPNGPIKDTLNWIRFSTTFYADSAYDNVVIGGFYDTLQISIDTLGYGQYNGSYYYLDSLVVKRLDTLSYVMSDSVLCAGDTFDVPVTTYYSFNANNTFTVQLSDANGSFTSPTTIGQLVADSSDTVRCVVPLNIANGTKYQIRVKASSPAQTALYNPTTLDIHNPDSSAINITHNSPLCMGETLSLSASTNVTPTTYTWTGPNSIYSTNATISFIGAGASYNGQYYSAVKFYGCEVYDTVSVIVNTPPAKPVATGTTTICAGDSIYLSATCATNGVTYSWVGPAGYTANTQNAYRNNTTTAMAGKYIAAATIDGCSSYDTLDITIKQSPPDVQITGNTTYCSGETLSLVSGSSITGVSYSWQGPNNISANTNQLSINNIAAHSAKWYVATHELNGCTKKDSVSVTVLQTPLPPSVSYNNPICIGETLQLTANNVSGNTYKWIGPNSFSSTQRIPLITNTTAADTGLYQAVAIANGCVSDTSDIQVVMSPSPFVVIQSSKDSICQGESVTFTTLQNNTGGSPSFLWYVNAQAVSSGATYTTNSLQHNDVIRCDMTEYTKCAAPFTDPSNDIQINVLPWLAPSVSITSDKTGPVKPYHYITFTANVTKGGNNPGYQWKRNGNDIGGAKSYTWSANTLSDNDSISVEITSSYMCPQPKNAKSNGIVVQILTSIDDIESIEDFALYPNPNKGTFTVKGKLKDARAVVIEVYDIQSKLLYKDQVEKQAREFRKTINMEGASAGVYLLKLIVGANEEAIMFTIH